LAAEVIVEHQHMPTPDRLADYRRRFEARYNEFLTQLGNLDANFLASDKDREALLDLAYERDLQQAAIRAYFDKRPLALNVPLRLKTRFRMLTSHVKQLWVNRKREQEQIARVLPASHNYLDFALSQRSTESLEKISEASPVPVARTPDRRGASSEDG
jgi:hypothetical protein